MNEIEKNLYLGDIFDAHFFKGTRVCVLEDKMACDEGSRPMKWSPILQLADNKTEIWANPQKLDETADLIDDLLKSGYRVLVHCFAGAERSPLALAWFLHKKRGMTISNAYKYLQEKRPIVQKRLYWTIPPPHTNRNPWDARLNWVGELLRLCS